VNRANAVRMDSCIASCAKKFCTCIAGIIPLAVDHTYYIRNYRFVYITTTSLIQLYSLKFTAPDSHLFSTFCKELLRNANPREVLRVQGKISSELAINEKENACRLLHMKIIFPFLFPRNVLTNELIRIQYFGREEQVLQDETIQPLKQKPYYIKSR
jgi:hypothetical protein